MEIKYDFSVDAWIQAIVVEGDSAEDCKNKLFEMSLADLIDAGYVKDFNINNIDEELVQKNLDIKVYNISYNDVAEDLPREVEVSVSVVDDIDIEEAILDELDYTIDRDKIDNFDYEILKEY